MLFQLLGDAGPHFRRREVQTGEILEVELPGTAKSEVRLTIDSGTLDIEIEGRNAGHYTLALEGVDEDRIDARLEDGLLVVELPFQNTARVVAVR